jgi:Holliday junction resolvase RusA-like endonuclease
MFDQPSFADPPFAIPADVVLDIPLPPSVNRTRKVDWIGHRKYTQWKRDAGMHLVANGQYRNAPRRLQQYELTITLDEQQCRLDPDNPVKAAIDLLRSLEIITDDTPKYARRIVIEWGKAVDGCRLTVRPLTSA